MYTLPAEPQSIGQVLSSSCHLYKKVFIKLLPFSIIFALLSIFPDVYFHSQKAIDFSLNVFLLHLAVEIVGMFLAVSMMYIVGSVMFGKLPGYFESLMIAVRKFPIYFLSAFVVSIVMINFLVLMFLLHDIFIGFPGTILSFLVFIDYVVIIAAVIFLNILFAFYLICVLFDNDGPIEALKHSARLVYPYWWRTFSVILITFMVFFAAVVFFEVIVDVPTIFLFRFPVGEVSFISHVVSAVIFVVMMPWLLSVMLSQYHDLKLR